MGIKEVQNNMSITSYTEFELSNGVKDQFGVLYSSDGKKLISFSEELESYKVKDGTEVICDTAFYRCYMLKDIYIPDSVQGIGRQAFYECLLLSDVRLSRQLLYIGAGAFQLCKNLSNIHLPDSLKIIDASVFDGCVLLQQITIPPKINNIHPYAFYNCQSLKKSIVESPTIHIGERAFAGCSNLVSIDFNSVQNKIESNINTDVKFCKSTTNSGIESHAFDGCFQLSKIDLPDSITYIGKRAFRHCFSLSTVTFGSHVNYVHEIAFESCIKLKYLIVPNNGSTTYNAIKEFSSKYIIKFEPLQQTTNLRLETFILGDKFPWLEYAYPGDHITPVLNYESFDVVISLKDIAWKEKRAFAMVLPVISIFIYKSIPFIIANFDDTVVVQFSINIQKMKIESIDHWLKSDYNIIRFFLLNGEDGTLASYIQLSLAHMKELKQIVACQRQLNKEQIDSIIEEGESKYSQYEMMVNATYVEAIK